MLIQMREQKLTEVKWFVWDPSGRLVTQPKTLSPSLLTPALFATWHSFSKSTPLEPTVSSQKSNFFSSTEIYFKNSAPFFFWLCTFLSTLTLQIPWWLGWLRICLQWRRPGFDPGVGKIPWEGNGNLLQYSCLDNSMDWGAWRATVHGVTKGRTRLSD